MAFYTNQYFKSSDIAAKAPTSHAASVNTYGQDSASNFGHLKVSDNYTSSAGAASAGIAASSKAVNEVYKIALQRARIYKLTKDTDLVVPTGMYLLIFRHNSTPNGNGMYLYSTASGSRFPIKEAPDITFQCDGTTIRYTATYSPSLTVFELG